MNRKGLELLIGFALHLRGRLNGTDQNVSRDALELSRLAKRLHYLDERYCNGTIESNEDGTGEYDRKTKSALVRAGAFLERYGYRAYHQSDPRGASLYALLPGQREHDPWHDMAVPY